MKQKIGVVLLLALLCFCFIPLQGAHAASTTWDFAEGRIGSGFRTFFTISNPTTSACQSSVKYIWTLDGDTVSSNKTVNFTVAPTTRYTVNANADVPVSRPATLSAVFSVCSGMTVERPMYMVAFNGTNSGTDTLGVTTPGTSWYVADLPTHLQGESFLAVLNPNDQASTVSVVYWNASGVQVATDSMTVGGNSRATFQPGNNPQVPDHTSAVISSDLPVVVERPSYYGAMGASDIVAASDPSANWYFAEGNTTETESLIIANTSTTSANVTVTLKSTSGHLQSFPLTVNAHAQAVFDVNANNNFAGSTSEVAADVTSTDANIVVQRHEVGVFTPLAGGWNTLFAADTMGAPNTAAVYDFGEGFTSVRYAESLALQNPTNSTQTVTVQLLNMLGHTYTTTYTLPQESRLTVDINALVSQHLAQVGEDSRAYAVSMHVTSTGQFVAERSMFYHTYPPAETQGANMVVGYTGNI